VPHLVRQQAAEPANFGVRSGQGFVIEGGRPGRERLRLGIEAVPVRLRGPWLLWDPRMSTRWRRHPSIIRWGPSTGSIPTGGRAQCPRQGAHA